MATFRCRRPDHWFYNRHLLLNTTTGALGLTAHFCHDTANLETEMESFSHHKKPKGEAKNINPNLTSTNVKYLMTVQTPAM